MSTSGSVPTVVAPATVNFVSRLLKHPLFVGIVGPLVVTLAGVAGASLQKSTGFPLGMGEPQIHIESPGAGSDVSGSPEIRGTVTGLRPGQMIWSFNSPEDSGKAYPDLGPCSVTDNNFSCKLTELAIFPGGTALGSDSQKFTLWTVVVDSDEAVRNITTKAQYNGIKPYIPVDQDGPPHIAGASGAADRVDVTCVKAIGCPIQPTQSASATATRVTNAANITYPPNGVRIRGSAITVVGSANVQDHLYLFDYDGSSYTRDTDSYLPIDSNSNWRFVDDGLEPGALYLILVRASEKCEAAIQNMRKDSDDTYTWNRIDPQCQIADRVAVTMTR